MCGGISQLDETVDAILVPDRFLSTLNCQPHLQRYAANVFLIPQQEGRLIRVHGLEAIERLPSLHRLSVSAKPGSRLGRVAGMVTLVHEDLLTIERDIDTIRHLVREGMFGVEPTATI